MVVVCVKGVIVGVSVTGSVVTCGGGVVVGMPVDGGVSAVAVVVGRVWFGLDVVWVSLVGDVLVAMVVGGVAGVVAGGGGVVVGVGPVGVTTGVVVGSGGVVRVGAVGVSDGGGVEGSEDDGSRVGVVCV